MKQPHAMTEPFQLFIDGFHAGSILLAVYLEPQERKKQLLTVVSGPLLSDGPAQRRFHGMRESSTPRPQNPETPAKMSPAPTKADSQKNGCQKALPMTPMSTKEPAAI